MDRKHGFGSSLIGFVSTLAVTLLVLPVASGLDSDDLLFHLSFEDGVSAAFGRGGGALTNQPMHVSDRLVEVACAQVTC